MSAITLRTTLSDWGYQIASATLPDPLPSPPADASQSEAWIRYPGWSQWSVSGAGFGGAVSVFVGQRAVSAVGAARQTEVTVGTTTTVVAGHAHDIRVELVGARTVQVYLDGELALATEAPGVSCWQAHPWFVLGEGNSGFEAHLTYVYGELSGQYAQIGQIARYFAASMSVTAYGVTQPILPYEADTVHAMGGWGSSGQVPTMVKRQPVCVGGLAQAHGDYDSDGSVAAVVQPSVAVSMGAPLTASPGLSWPVAGWLAGTCADGPYTFGGHAWALASPLGLSGGGPLVADVTGICAVRSSDDDVWRTACTTEAPHGAVVACGAGHLALPGTSTLRSPNGGIDWYTDLSLDGRRSLVYLAWEPADGYLSDADWRLGDYPLAVGCQLVGSATRLIAHGVRGDAVVAELSAQQAGAWRLWPWLHQRDDGNRLIGLLAAGRYREWQAPPDGASWTLVADEAVGPAGGAAAVSAARGRDGTVLAVGFDPASMDVVAWWRPAPTGGWAGPATVCQTTAAVTPYATHRADGAWEAGWLNAGTWYRALADTPPGPWRMT